MQQFAKHRSDNNLLFTGIIIILPFLLFWRWVFKGEVLFWGTSLFQFWPWHYLVKTALLNGEWPLWNPLLGNGTPLLANLQSAVFYPPNLLYLLLPVEHALTLSVILHLVLAGTLMYLYARHLGLLPFAATIAALSYMFSGYLVGRTQFVTMINAAAWFPLLLFLSDKIATRQAGINILWLALVLAVQLLAGHAQLWFYGLCLIGAYTFFRSWQTTKKTYHPSHNASRIAFFINPIWKSGLAVGLSLLLSAVQILPTAEFVSQSPRSGGAERIFALTYSFWPWRLITLLAPNFFGHPAQANYWGYATYWEDHAYIGVLPFILALVAIWQYYKPFLWRLRRPLPNQPKIQNPNPIPSTRLTQTPGNIEQSKIQNPKSKIQNQVVPFFAALIPVSLVLAMGWNTPIYLWVFDTVPGFNSFQAPARLLIWYTIAVSVLAGIGAQSFEINTKNRPNWRRLLAACVALTAAGFIAESFVAGRDFTFLTATRSAGILLILSITLLLIRPNKDKQHLHPQNADHGLALSNQMQSNGNPGFIKESLWQGVVIIFVCVDLLLAAFPIIPTLPAKIFTQSVAGAERLSPKSEHYRFFVNDRFSYTTLYNQYFNFKTFGPSDINYWQGLKETLVPNFGVYAKLPSANNSDPLVVKRRQQLTEQLKRADTTLQARLLSMMNVAYFVNSDNSQSWPLIYNTESITIQRVPDALPRAYFAPRAYDAQDNAEAIARLTAPDFDPRRETVIMGSETDLPSLDVEDATPSKVWPVTVNEQGINRLKLTVNAPSAGYVVLTDTFYPGWQATVDGQASDILQANLAFRAVAVKAGRHEINFNYRPLSFTFGLWTSIVTCLIMVVMVRYL